MWPNVKIVTRVASFSHQVWHFQTPNMMFGVSNHLTLNHASFSQIQSPSVVFESTKVSIDFDVWNDSKSPDMGERWFDGVLNQHKVRIWQNKRQVFWLKDASQLCQFQLGSAFAAPDLVQTFAVLRTLFSLMRGWATNKSSLRLDSKKKLAIFGYRKQCYTTWYLYRSWIIIWKGENFKKPQFWAFLPLGGVSEG